MPEIKCVQNYSVVLPFVNQEKIKTLQAELQVVTNNKTMLEKELQEVITLTSTELEEYQEKVLELEDEVNSDHIVTLCCYIQGLLQDGHLCLKYPVYTSVIAQFKNANFYLFHSFKSPDASRSESES